MKTHREHEKLSTMKNFSTIAVKLSTSYESPPPDPLLRGDCVPPTAKRRLSFAGLRSARLPPEENSQENDNSQKPRNPEERFPFALSHAFLFG